MEKSEVTTNKTKGGIIAQVAVLFAIGMLAIGLATFFTEQFISEGTIKAQTSDLLEDLSNEVIMTVD